MELSVGVRGSFSHTVTREMLAKSMHSGALEVFATPCLIAFMEAAAQDSVAGLVGEGNGTVGTKLVVDHLSPTPLGMCVRAESELIEIDGRRLVFRVSAFDDCVKIGEGTHERFIINIAKFLEKCNAKSTQI